MTAPIGVFVVDDHPIVREGLTSVLGRETDMVVVGQASSGEEALDLLENVNPDVLVLDQQLKGMSGIDLCREIAERRINARVVILSGFREERTIEAALLAGASGYVFKDVDSTELLRAIRAAAGGLRTVDPKAARFRTWAVRDHEDHEDASLCTRHVEVLRGMAAGQTAREIACATGLSYHTVRTYVREIYAKLGVGNRASAVALATRRGLI